MKKPYVTPTTSTVNVCVQPILTGSVTAFDDVPGYGCSSKCRYWHFCRDRQPGVFCNDKKYKDE